MRFVAVAGAGSVRRTARGGGDQLAVLGLVINGMVLLNTCYLDTALLRVTDVPMDGTVRRGTRGMSHAPWDASRCSRGQVACGAWLAAMEMRARSLLSGLTPRPLVRPMSFLPGALAHRSVIDSA
jgi:hypothetical protein